MALFELFGGPEVGALARRRFLEGHTDEATLEAWVRLAFPRDTRTPRDPAVAQRTIRRPEVTRWLTRPGGEGHTFNLFPVLSRVQCPTLVLGGEEDRSRRVWFASSGSRRAGTESSPMPVRTPWR